MEIKELEELINSIRRKGQIMTPYMIKLLAIILIMNVGLESIRLIKLWGGPSTRRAETILIVAVMLTSVIFLITFYMKLPYLG